MSVRKMSSHSLFILTFHKKHAPHLQAHCTLYFRFLFISKQTPHVLTCNALPHKNYFHNCFIVNKHPTSLRLMP